MTTRRPQVCGRPTRVDRNISQNYHEIVKKCQAEGILFEDPVFRAVDSSIYFDKAPPRMFEWKRPKEICSKPEYIAGGASRFDVKEGYLDNSWFVAAVASLTCQPTLLNRVIVPEQCFSGPGYVGCFRFNIWNQGDWEEVVVDDRLPTYNNKLVYIHSAGRNEFWGALLEKAYAKLNGSYESLRGGVISDAMVDFTGGVTETFDLEKTGPELFTIMLKAYARGSLMGCSADGEPGARGANGLVKGHAYTVTAAKHVQIKTRVREDKTPLVRVRNPWGNEREWTGAWSDKSREWSLIPPNEREAIGLTFEDDGEFWMSFTDWQSNFNKLEICNLGPDSLAEKGKISWETRTEVGEWIRGSTAGGCRNFINSFASNPQYRIVLNDSDEDEDDLCTLVVALLQKDRRKLRRLGKDMLTIGFAIYKLEGDDSNRSSRLPTDFFKYNSSLARSPNFINMREVCGRYKLPPGNYVIIPSTMSPNETGSFLLRIFIEKPGGISEMDEETREVDVQEASPPTEEDSAVIDKIKGVFTKIAGVDREIDAYELKEILNAAFGRGDYQNGSCFEFDGFTTDMCCSMVAMLDGDLTGKLGLEEFKVLWNDLRSWKGEFTKYDSDKSGKLNSYELRQALRGCGYQLRNRTFTSIALRYSSKSGDIEFDGFILCLIRLKTMMASFSALQKNGIASYNLDTFIQTTVYS